MHLDVLKGIVSRDEIRFLKILKNLTVLSVLVALMLIADGLKIALTALNNCKIFACFYESTY
jgi:hypothetical protein